MHRLNANKNTVSGTSSLGDSSIRRIEEGLNVSKSRRASKQTKVSTMQKTAKKIRDDKPQDDAKRIIVASLNDIPANFERIGTGFYREGHHLWEMSPGKGGFVLTRKRGEDHVLGYDPEPIMKKESAILISDRNGVELKKGHRVKFPRHGKMATGTILLLTPSSLDLGMDDDSVMSLPPGMVEFLEEEMAEGEHSEKGLQALEEFLKEESGEEEHSDKEGSSDLEDFVEEEEAEGEHSEEAIEALEDFFEEEMGEEEHSDKEAGDEFEPEIEKKPKSDYTGPQSSQVGGIGGIARKKAQNDQSGQSEEPGISEPVFEQPASFPDYEQAGAHSAIANKLNELGDGSAVVIVSEDQGSQYFATKNGNKYDLYMVENKLTQFPGVSTVEDLMEFEGNIGRFSVMANPKVAKIIKAAINTIHDSDEMQTWKEYWYNLGQKVAEGKIPQPKLTEEEKKQRRKDRRKQRQLERSGLPKGVALPPKQSLKDSDDMARYKEIIKIYETNFDELEYAITSIDPEDPAADALAADAVIETLDRIKQERHELEERDEEEMEDELSLDSPSEFEIEMEKNSSKIVVSMSEL